MCDLPYKINEFDHLISIAVFHHLSTNERRVRAFNEMLRVTKQNGTILISVWKYNQLNKKGNPKFSKKDELVPFNIPKKGGKLEEHKRYYHLYDSGEFEDFLIPYTKTKKIKLLQMIDSYNNFFYILEKL